MRLIALLTLLALVVTAAPATAQASDPNDACNWTAPDTCTGNYSSCLAWCAGYGADIYGSFGACRRSCNRLYCCFV